MRIAAGQSFLQRRQPRHQGLDQGFLLGMEPTQALGDLGDRAGAGRDFGLERREIALAGVLGLAQRLEARFQPRLRLARRALARGFRRAIAFELGQPRLDRREPRQHRRDAGVLLGIEPAELFGHGGQRGGQWGHPGRRLGLGPGSQSGDPFLNRRRRRRLRGPRLVDPRLQPFEEPARLGEIAHLLERAQPGAQLVEPGERGLERGVLVADQPDQRAGHGLQPVLGRARRRQRLDPRLEPGLDLVEPQFDAPHHRLGGGRVRPGPAFRLGPRFDPSLGQGPRPAPPRPGEGDKEHRKPTKREPRHDTYLIHRHCPA